MARRNYGQHCAVARALDRVGDRWVLLLIRELLPGPKRFSDLLGGLRGIGPNLLSQRLKELEEEGLVRRGYLPPPSASAIYELTGVGRGLEPAILALGRWGLQFVGMGGPEDLFQPEWALLALRFVFQADAAAGVTETYEFDLGGSRLHAEVEDGTLRVLPGPAAAPALRMTMDAETFLAIGGGRLTAEEAVSTGRARVEGDPEAVARCLRMFRPPPAPAE